MSLIATSKSNLLAVSRIDNVTPSLRKLRDTIRRFTRKSSLIKEQRKA
jgi:hypothetical protein